jgi:cell division protein FtsZ
VPHPEDVMTFSIEFADDSNNEYQANIKVVGIGGSGGNAVNTMISFGLEGVEFIVANTDAQALNASAAPVKLPIGQTITRGLGAGANPEKGRKAALEDVTQIKQFLQGADMVFITAGMGGGTGTGAAPIIAQIAREEGALCVGVVTRPFAFEGKQRARIAEAGLNELASQVDSLITIPNQKLLTFSDEDLSFTEAFRRADEVLYQAVKGISDLIQLNGVVNVDFADVKTIMSNRGRAIMGTGCAKGDGRAALATHMAISSPLLDNISVEGATAVLVNIVGGSTLKIKEMEEATEIVYEQAHEDANIIWGASVDESMGDMIKVTVIATGFGQYAEEVVREQESQRPTMVAVPQQVATSRVAPQGMPSRAAIDTRFHPAASTSSRAPAPASSAPAPAPVSRHPRSTFAPNADLDWDAPAFSRHSGEYPPR